jgi:replicative DNA helicase Mcm
METITQSSPYQTQFEEFLNAKYRSEMERLASVYPDEKSISIDYKVLEEYDTDLADELIQNPYPIAKAAQDAISQMNFLNPKGEKVRLNIRFVGFPEDGKTLVRNVDSEHIGKFLSMDGVVTTVTESRPKIVNAVFECKHCGRVYNIPQTDKMGKFSEPAGCVCERKNFQLLLEQCTFIDTQRAEIQEPLELLRGGEQAKKMELWIEDDLTSRIVPGDKVEITGTLNLHNPKARGSIYDKFLDVNSITQVQKEFENIKLTEEEERQIRELANDPKIYDKIVASIAPSIYGHSEIKEAIALQLLGGTQGKVKADGMKIRSDMHILLIGDPGTAKTQLLIYVNQLAPKGVYVSGKSSSAAGLTATAEKDESTDGRWTLKAGALVLAAGGMASIDEFDKMNEEDSSAMHEAMESQVIHITKAGIHAMFKANTAILAAANPKYGRFDPNESPAAQFNIPPTLISRFDLIFPIKDELDEAKDREMVKHILTSHFTAGVKAKGSYDKKEMLKAEERVLPAIEPELLRSYIAYARKEIKPLLTKEAMDKIEAFYVDLRKMGQRQKSVPITPRYLEAIIRLAEASAKGRLSETVDLEDSERAIRLMKFCLSGVGVDPETGKFDIDIIAVGASRSKQDRLKVVYRAVKALSEGTEGATHEALLEEAKTQGLRGEEFEDALSSLLRNGDVYKPRHGIYRPADEKG